MAGTAAMEGAALMATAGKEGMEEPAIRAREAVEGMEAIVPGIRAATGGTVVIAITVKAETEETEDMVQGEEVKEVRVVPDPWKWEWWTERQQKLALGTR